MPIGAKNLGGGPIHPKAVALAAGFGMDLSNFSDPRKPPGFFAVDLESRKFLGIVNTAHPSEVYLAEMSREIADVLAKGWAFCCNPPTDQRPTEMELNFEAIDLVPALVFRPQ